MTTTTPTTTDIFAQICIRIIREQENIIGAYAWDEAGRVQGLAVNQKAGTVSITGDAKKVIDDLVERYVQLFGRLSRDVSRESVVDLTADIPADEVPASLK